MGRKVTGKNSDGIKGGFSAVRKDPKEFEKLEKKEVKAILDEYKESRFISPETNIERIVDVIWQKNELDEVGTILGYIIINTPSKESKEKDYIFGYSKTGLAELKKMGYENVRLVQFPASQEIYISPTMFNNFADKVMPNRDKVDFFEEEKDFIGKRIDTFSKSATDDYYLTTKGLYVERLKDQQASSKKDISGLAREVLRNKAIVHNILNFTASFEEGLSEEENWMLMAYLKLKKDFLNGDHIAGKSIEEVLKVVRQYKGTETAKMRDSMIPTKTDVSKTETIPEKELDSLGAVILNDKVISRYIDSHFEEYTEPLDYIWMDANNHPIILEVEKGPKKQGIKKPSSKVQTSIKLNDREIFMLKLYLLSQNECGVNTVYFNKNIGDLKSKFIAYEQSEEAEKRFRTYCEGQDGKDR